MSHDPDRFAIVPIYSDSTGAQVNFPDAIMTGSMSAVMARIKDSKQMQADLRISNEADKVRKAKAELVARADSIAAREDAAIQAEDLIRQLVDKVDTLATRMDSFEEQAEEQERAAISAAEYSRPPGVADEDEPTPEPIHPTGDLHALEAKEPLEDDEGPGDLPRSLTEKVPVPTGTETEFPGPREPTARDPIGY